MKEAQGARDARTTWWPSPARQLRLRLVRRGWLRSGRRRRQSSWRSRRGSASGHELAGRSARRHESRQMWMRSSTEGCVCTGQGSWSSTKTTSGVRSQRRRSGARCTCTRCLRAVQQSLMQRPGEKITQMMRTARHFCLFAVKNPHVVDPERIPPSKAYQRAFLAGPRTMSVLLFSQTCRVDLLDPRTPSSRRFGRTALRAFDSTPLTY
mmetsp:Transcript_9448/g.22721  ORF Transcript_9448/g.22721 Transcript_9448/m.22721 type:complete len:209 (-) Transcript_9448:65-691(-)